MERPMKSILVPCDQSDAMPSVFASASLLAQRLDSTIEGLALRPIHVEIVAPDPIVAVTFPPADWNDADFVSKARRRFEDSVSGTGDTRHRWRPGPSVDDAGLGSLARVYDIAVISRPGSNGGGPRMTTLESLLFDSGQPVLVSPPVPPTSLGENIVVSWNCSTEQARATACAMPVLRKARNVTVIAIEGLTSPGPSISLACDWLKVNGVNARELTMGNGGRRPAEVLLDESRKLGADLIVKGAYTQSRLRQMIFGGATSYLLAHSTLPMLMAH
jgi:hypothetical protein